MKKLILILAIALCASQALAVLDVNVAKVGSTVTVYYAGAGTSEATRPRAFALELTLDGTGTFDSFASYKTGESTAASPGYGIYPATIIIDSAGNVTDDGTPLAASGDPGAGDGLASSHIVLEFGSLYYGEPNAPLTAGTLCVLNITPGTSTQVTMVGEDNFRITDGVDDAGVVFEDGSTYKVNVGGGGPVPDCWDTVNECGGQMKGDANCDGGVNFVDLGLLKVAIFSSSGDGSGRYNCCADFNHDLACNFIDLGIMKANIFTSGWTPATGNTNCPAGAQP